MENLKGMKQKELIAVAKEFGIAFKPGMKNADLIEKIEAAQKPKLICPTCKSEYEAHNFTYPELCVICSDIKMEEDIDAEQEMIDALPVKPEPKKPAAPAEKKSSKPKKFTDEEIRFIRESVASKTHSKKHLADQFNTSWNTIHYIVIGKFYSNVA